MSLYDQADKIDSKDTGTNRDPLLPQGHYPELGVLSIGEFRGGEHKTGPLFFKTRVVVLKAANGAKVGVVGAYMEQLDQTKFPKHAPEAMARVKKLVGQLFGLTDTDQINAQVTGAVIRGCFAQDGKVLAGRVFSATVTHKVTGAGKTIGKFDTAAVLENGKVKEVDVTAHAAANPEPEFGAVPAEQTQTKAIAPAPIAPPAAPPAAPAPAATFPPPGWKTHPTAPDAYYKDGMPSCINGAELRTLAATGRA